MINSYEVGATWRLIDQVTPALAKIATEVRRFDGLLAQVQGKLDALGGAFKAVSDVRFAGVNRGLTGISERLERIEKRAAGATAALGKVGGAMPMLPGGGGGAGRPGGGANNLMHRPDRHGAGLMLGTAGFFGLQEVGGGIADEADNLKG